MSDAFMWDAARMRLKDLLEQEWRGWNQSSLARATGKQPKQVNTYVNGTTMPPADWLVMVFRVMPLSADYLFQGRGPPERQEPGEAEKTLEAIRELIDPRYEAEPSFHSLILSWRGPVIFPIHPPIFPPKTLKKVSVVGKQLRYQWLRDAREVVARPRLLINGERDRRSIDTWDRSKDLIAHGAWGQGLRRR